jgi:hypothetical protein
MHVLRHAHEVSAYLSTHTNTEIGSLIQLRLSELLQDDDTTMEELVFFVVLEPGDTREHLEAALGASVLTTDGQPLWELLEEHTTCFEMVVVLSSDGFGSLVFIPKQPETDPDLRTLCQQYATPAQEDIDP